MKIGRTIKAEERLKNLQIGSPVKLVLATSFYGGESEEIALHKMLAEHREHGEWFRLTDEVIEVMEVAEKQGQYGINQLLDKAGIDKPQHEDYDISMLDIVSPK